MAHNDYGRPVATAMRVDSFPRQVALEHNKGYPWWRQRERPDLLMVNNFWTWTEGQETCKRRGEVVSFLALLLFLFEF